MTSVDKPFRIVPLDHDQDKEDLDYWLSKTPEERVEAAEILRRRIALIQHADESRLRRVFQIVKQP